MTTTADALEVMTVVAACHHRTAPRMDDREVALATAKIWSDLFDGHDLSVAELVAAVKRRAKILSEAPEAADIIRVARAYRSDQMARDLPPDEPDAYWGSGQRPSGHYPGDLKAEPDPPEYPAHWDSRQRTSVYWYAVAMHAMPRSTKGWEAVAAQLKRKQAEREL